jgi:hypothetical protein
VGKVKIHGHTRLHEWSVKIGGVSKPIFNGTKAAWTGSEYMYFDA